MEINLWITLERLSKCVYWSVNQIRPILSQLISCQTSQGEYWTRTGTYSTPARKTLNYYTSMVLPFSKLKKKKSNCASNMTFTTIINSRSVISLMRRATYGDRRVYPQGRVKQDVVEEVLEQSAPCWQVYEVLRQLQEAIENILSHVLPWRLNQNFRIHFILPKYWQYEHLNEQLLKLNNNMKIIYENNILYIDTTWYYRVEGDSQKVLKLCWYRSHATCGNQKQDNVAVGLWEVFSSCHSVGGSGWNLTNSKRSGKYIIVRLIQSNG